VPSRPVTHLVDTCRRQRTPHRETERPFRPGSPSDGFGQKRSSLDRSIPTSVRERLMDCGPGGFENALTIAPVSPQYPAFSQRIENWEIQSHTQD
jgi:hypothetical protein